MIKRYSSSHWLLHMSISEQPIIKTYLTRQQLIMIISMILQQYRVGYMQFIFSLWSRCYLPYTFTILKRKVFAAIVFDNSIRMYILLALNYFLIKIILVCLSIYYFRCVLRFFLLFNKYCLFRFRYQLFSFFSLTP
jgi:hypothetical protein